MIPVPCVAGWIRRSLELSHGYAADCVADIPDERLAEQPTGVKNHAAWTLVHLAVSLQLVGETIGAGDWLAPEWTKLYGTGSTPVPDRRAYPALESMLGALREGRERVIARVEIGGAELLAQPLEHDVVSQYLPTLGHVVTQILVAHTAYHVGQLQAWRHAIGFRGVGYPFL